MPGHELAHCIHDPLGVLTLELAIAGRVQAAKVGHDLKGSQGVSRPRKFSRFAIAVQKTRTPDFSIPEIKLQNLFVQSGGGSMW